MCSRINILRNEIAADGGRHRQRKILFLLRFILLHCWRLAATHSSWPSNDPVRMRVTWRLEIIRKNQHKFLSYPSDIATFVCVCSSAGMRQCHPVSGGAIFVSCGGSSRSISVNMFVMRTTSSCSVSQDKGMCWNHKTEYLSGRNLHNWPFETAATPPGIPD